MATVDIENVKARIDKLKNQRSEAEGKKKAIEETWQRDYNVSSLAEAEALQEKIEQELEDNRAAQEEYLEAADKLLTEAGV
jgi:hypothetical protein